MIKIDKLVLGTGYRPVVIAEMSGNHNQSLDRALDIVTAAADSGADILKLQTYTAETITLDVDNDHFLDSHPNSLWSGQRLYDLYSKAHTPWEWHEPIMVRAKTLGMVCISTPFDETAVDFLETLNVPAYKIASPELIHIPLIKKVASTGKPIILSTGMGSLSEIDDAVKAVRAVGAANPILLKCLSAYPANPADSNVLTIPNLRENFDCEVGISDHTLGLGVPLAAVAHGACIVEKHFTLRREDGGVDAPFSLEPEELAQLVLETKAAWQSLGSVTYGPLSAEDSSRKGRRSIFFSEDVKKGGIVTEKNIRIVRPAFGLAPKYYDTLLGRKVARDVTKGTATSWSIIE